jgi:hypothetical protein
VSVEKGEDLRPGLETYPRWQVVALAAGPLMVAGYFTAGVSPLVTVLGSIAGMAVGQEMLRVIARWLTPGRAKKK